MDRITYYAALLANIIQMGVVAFIFTNAYGREAYLALLLLVPPIISISALRFTPDHEERKLTRLVNKARLRKELGTLDK